MEYQQKVNQLNLSNTLNNRQASNRTMVSRTANIMPSGGTSSLRAISKSNSASSLIHGNNNGHVDNLSGHHATLDTHRRAATVSPQPFTSVDRPAIIAPSAADCSMNQFRPGTYPQLKRASLTNI